MSTEIATRTEPTDQPEVAGAVELYPSKLAQWARDAKLAGVVAVSLARTSFVPQPMQNKPEEVTAAILTGQEVGLEPMASVRSINLIQGTPALSAMAMRALVLARGHKVWLVESTASRAIVRGRRAADDHDQESVWTLDRAKQLGLTGKQNWRNQPQAMLIARATAEVCRLIAPDALLGLPYATEELSDDDDTVNESGTKPAPGKRRTARRATSAPADPMPEPEPEPARPEPEPDSAAGPADEAATPASEGDSDAVTSAQLGMMGALYTEVGITERAERLAHSSATVGRQLGSSKELSKAEASRVIDSLMRARDDLPTEPYPEPPVQEGA